MSCRRIKYWCLVLAISKFPEAKASRQRLLGLKLEESLLLDVEPSQPRRVKLAPAQQQWLSDQSAELRKRLTEPRKQRETDQLLDPMIPVKMVKLKVGPPATSACSRCVSLR